MVADHARKNYVRRQSGKHTPLARSNRSGRLESRLANGRRLLADEWRELTEVWHALLAGEEPDSHVFPSDGLNCEVGFSARITARSHNIRFRDPEQPYGLSIDPGIEISLGCETKWNDDVTFADDDVDDVILSILGISAASHLIGRPGADRGGAHRFIPLTLAGSVTEFSYFGSRAYPTIPQAPYAQLGEAATAVLQARITEEIYRQVEASAALFKLTPAQRKQFQYVDYTQHGFAIPDDEDAGMDSSERDLRSAS